MGKFYLENQVTWFKHRTEKAHREKMGAGGELAGSPTETIEVHFTYHLKGRPPRHLRVIESSKPLISVGCSNGYVGDVDEPGSVLVRAFLAKLGGLEMYPAILVGPDDFSDKFILRLGME